MERSATRPMSLYHPGDGRLSSHVCSTNHARICAGSDVTDNNVSHKQMAGSAADMSMLDQSAALMDDLDMVCLHNAAFSSVD